MTTTRELDTTPHPLRLYLKAAVTGFGSGGGDLPDEELAVTGVTVDRDHLADYDRVCGFRLRDRLPSTFIHVLGFPLGVDLLARRSFPLSLPGMVHLRNLIVQHRPVRLDEALDLRTRLDNLRPHRKGRAVDVVATAEVAGETVWEGVSTYLSRGDGTEDASDDAPEASWSDDPPRRAEWRVPAAIGRRYGAVSGDRMPIHLHPLPAKMMGFPRQIAHGMWTKARALAALEPVLPDSYRVDVGFKKPLVVPATVVFATDRREGERRLEVRDADSGAPHLRGTLSPRS